MQKFFKPSFLKSSIAAVCATAILAAGVPIAVRATSLTATTTDYLNLREGAGTNTKVLLTLGKDVSVTVLDNSSSQWAKVETSRGRVGYCFKEYLHFPANAASSSGITATTTDYLNMRTGAGLGNRIIVTLAKGTSLTVLDNSNADWVCVQTSNGKQGWCSRQYLRLSGGTSSAGITATTTDYLNMRTGAGLNYQIIVTLAKGIKLSVLDNSNASWVRIQTSNGRQGWCSRQYLTLCGGQDSPAPKEPPSTDSPTAATVTADVLRLRQGPSTSTAIAGYLSNGTILKPLSNVQNGWIKVQTSGGKTGYVSADFVKLTYGSSQTGSSSGTQTTGSDKTGGSSGTQTTGSDKTKPVSTIASATVTADVLRLRQGPSTSTAITGYLPNGTVLKPLSDVQNGWIKVQTSGGKTGYVSADFVKLTYTSTSGSGTGTSGSSGNGQTTSDITGAVVTADVLRLRQGPGTSTAVIGYLPNGTVLKALSDVQNNWIKIQTSGGKTGYVCAEYVKLVHSGETLPSQSSGNVKISASSGTIPQGKTMWISSSGVDSWSSSDPSVATVTNGFVYAVTPGKAQITASCGSSKAVCSISVTDAEPVREAYASPNIAGPGSKITFTAVTDTSRDGVVFDIVQPDGSKKELKASSSKTEITDGVKTVVWTVCASFQAAGSYSFTARSSKNGTLSSSGVSSTALVSSQTSSTATTDESRRASDKVLSMIANWEGYCPQVYADQLASSHVPTIGYGDTLGSNELFYNHLSQTEAWALLVNKVNNSSYTSELNRMIQNRHYLMNQQQADCLIDFAYNVGAGYFNSSSGADFRKIMDNAVIPPDIPSAGLAAKVTYGTSVRANRSLSSDSLCYMPSGTSVTVVGKDFTNTKDGWYQVRLSNGAKGWINSGYVSLSNAISLKHDLNYTNAYAFGTELILWNQAGGKFYAGLFYRRLSEANIYNYGDYTICNCHNVNKECSQYTYPPSASWLF